MAVTLFPSLAGYQRRWVTRDVVAGITVWAVLVPEALAYATIAGVSPVVGLYAAPAALLRPEAGLFFANAEAVRAAVRTEVARRRPHAVVIDAQTVPYVDLTAVRTLDQLTGDLAREGIHLAVARDAAPDKVRAAFDGENPQLISTNLSQNEEDRLREVFAA